MHYYALDDMWESEHNYDHVYPEEIGIDAAEAEQAALANGLTYAGEAPDGTPLYYASDGTGMRALALRILSRLPSSYQHSHLAGPYDVDGVALDPTAIGFLLGPHFELLAPDGTPVVDENGLGIIFNPPTGTEFAFQKQANNEESEDEESVQIIVERDDDSEEKSVHTATSSGSSNSAESKRLHTRHESRASNIRHGKVEDDSATGEEVSGDDSYSQYSGSKSTGSSSRSSHDEEEHKPTPRNSNWAASEVIPRTMRANSRRGAAVSSDDVVIDMRTAHTGAAKPPLSARGASFVLTMPTPRIGMDTARSARSDAASHVTGAGSGLTARDRAGGRFFFPPGQPSPRDSGVSLRSGSTPRQGEHGRASSTISQTVSKLLGLVEGESSDSDEEPLPVHNRRVSAPSEFPIVRINSGTSSHRPSQSAPAVHGGRTQDSRRGEELYGYHDPVTNRWVPPTRQIEDDGSDVDEDYDEKITDTVVPGSHNRNSSVRHRSGGSNLSNVHEAADEVDVGDDDEDEDEDGYLDLADLLADAEIQSSKVMARQNLNHKTL
jgi:hypothetical protein